MVRTRGEGKEGKKGRRGEGGKEGEERGRGEGKRGEEERYHSLDCRMEWSHICSIRPIPARHLPLHNIHARWVSIKHQQ